MDKNLLQKFIDALVEFIEGFFNVKPEEKKYVYITHIPAPKEKSEAVRFVQIQVNKYHGAKILTEDGDYGPKTKTEISLIQKKHGLAGSGILGPKTIEILNIKIKESSNHESKPESKSMSWVNVLLKYKGKHESDPAFQEYMNTYWAKSGLPNFKGLVGSARAWCGLFVFMGLVVAGYKTPVNSFRAKAWDGYGHAIDWKKDGIPRGAIIRINSSGNCTAASGNHVTTANGDCTAATLNKPNATVGALGGNQQNSVKVSIYKVSTLCYVGWPKETVVGTPVAKPGKVLKDNNCSGTGPTNESTR